MPAMAMINVYWSPPTMNRRLSAIHAVSKPATEKKNPRIRKMTTQTRAVFNRNGTRALACDQVS